MFSFILVGSSRSSEVLLEISLDVGSELGHKLDHVETSAEIGSELGGVVIAVDLKKINFNYSFLEDANAR